MNRSARITASNAPTVASQSHTGTFIRSNLPDESVGHRPTSLPPVHDRTDRRHRASAAVLTVPPREGYSPWHSPVFLKFGDMPSTATRAVVEVSASIWSAWPAHDRAYHRSPPPMGMMGGWFWRLPSSASTPAV